MQNNQELEHHKIDIAKMMCNYILNGIDFTTFYSLGSTIEGAKSSTRHLADRLYAQYDDHYAGYNTGKYVAAALKALERTEQYYDDFLKVKCTKSQNQAISDILNHDNETLRSLKSDIEKMKQFFKEPDIDQYHPEAIAGIINDISTKEDIITKIVDNNLTRINNTLTNTNEDTQNAVKKEIKELYQDLNATYKKDLEELTKELKSAAQLAFEERQFLLALYSTYTTQDKAKLEKIDPNQQNIAGQVTTTPRVRKLKTLEEIAKELQNNQTPLTFRSISGQKLTIKNGEIIIKIPRRLFSLSFFHSDPDDRLIAEYESISRMTKLLYPKDNKIILNFGRGNTIKDQHNQIKELSEYDKKIGQKMLQGSLNAGYDLKNITITIRGHVLNDQNSLMRELDIDHQTLNNMLSTAKVTTDFEQTKRTNDLKGKIVQIRQKATLRVPYDDTSSQTHTPP